MGKVGGGEGSGWGRSEMGKVGDGEVGKVGKRGRLGSRKGEGWR